MDDSAPVPSGDIGPLTDAAVRDDLAALNQSIASGAPPDGEKDGNEWTPLFHAARRGHLSIVQALVEAGASVFCTSKPFKNTPLMEAVFWGHVECAAVLCAYGSDVNYANIRGNTALIWASEKGHVSCVELLLNQGADPDAFNNEGRTAINVAKDRYIRDLLKKAAGYPMPSGSMTGALSSSYVPLVDGPMGQAATSFVGPTQKTLADLSQSGISMNHSQGSFSMQSQQQTGINMSQASVPAGILHDPPSGGVVGVQTIQQQMAVLQQQMNAMARTMNGQQRDTTMSNIGAQVSQLAGQMTQLAAGFDATATQKLPFHVVPHLMVGGAAAEAAAQRRAQHSAQQHAQQQAGQAGAPMSNVSGSGSGLGPTSPTSPVPGMTAQIAMSHKQTHGPPGTPFTVSEMLYTKGGSGDPEYYKQQLKELLEAYQSQKEAHTRQLADIQRKLAEALRERGVHEKSCEIANRTARESTDRIDALTAQLEAVTEDRDSALATLAEIEALMTDAGQEEQLRRMDALQLELESERASATAATRDRDAAMEELALLKIKVSEEARRADQAERKQRGLKKELLRIESMVRQAGEMQNELDVMTTDKSAKEEQLQKLKDELEGYQNVSYRSQDTSNQ